MGKKQQGKVVSLIVAAFLIGLVPSCSFNATKSQAQSTESESEKSHRILYILGDNAINSPRNPASFSASRGDVTLLDASRDGYLFTGWTSDDSAIPAKQFLIPGSRQEDITVTAHWYDPNPVSLLTSSLTYSETTSNIYYYLNFSLGAQQEELFTLVTTTVHESGIKTFVVDLGKAEKAENGLYKLAFATTSLAPIYLKDDSGQLTFVSAQGEAFAGGSLLPACRSVPPFMNQECYGYRDFAQYTNGADLQNAYSFLWEEAHHLVTSKEDLNDATSYFAQFDYAAYHLSLEEGLAVVSSLLLDAPELYWIQQSFQTQDTKIFLRVDLAYWTSKARQQADAAISQMLVGAIAAVKEKTTDLEKYLALHDFLCERGHYAYKEDGRTPSKAVWAHNIVGMATGDGSVCEGYAESFRLCCLALGLESLCVTGQLVKDNSSHEWNLLKVQETYYYADLTFDDSKETVSHDYFAMGSAKALDERILSGHVFGINYLYTLPSVSSTDLTY